jgi:CheY-like chemotaxis protein
LKKLAEFMDGDDFIRTPFRMLIAEDESLVRELLREMISFAFPDIKIDFAEDGFVALDMLARIDYDFLLTDVSMPGMNGIQAATEALRRNPDLWVAGMSGNTWGREAFLSAEGVGRLDSVPMKRYPKTFPCPKRRLPTSKPSLDCLMKWMKHTAS